MPPKCWWCGADMIWGCDFSFEDCGMDGEGIVATFSCPGCQGTAEFYTAVDEEDPETTEDAEK